MRPLDVVVLLKIISKGNQPWNQKPLAEELRMSQSEISKSLVRSKYAGLLDPGGKKVRNLALIEFLQFGIAYVFPQQPGALVRGVPTAHSASPLNQIIQSTEHYVWPSGKGKLRGQSIIPLYPLVVDAVKLEFADFIKELNKAIKKAGGEKLSKMDEMEWMEVFETKKAEAQNLKSEID